MSQSDHPGATLKARRKAQGWTRAELAHRAALDPRVVQLVELGEWEEHEALGRLDAVLARAEAGEEDPVLAPPEPPPEQRIGEDLGEGSGEGSGRGSAGLVSGEIPEA